MAEITTLEELISFPVRIVCEGNWAKNYPGEEQHPQYSHIYVNDLAGDDYEQWWIKPAGRGLYTIRNVGTQYWARVYGEVNGSPQFDKEGCEFSIESAGNGQWKIHFPNNDAVWTVREKGPGFPNTIFLEPATGGANQLFKFPKAK